MSDDAWTQEELPRLALALYAASLDQGGFAEALDACRAALGADAAAYRIGAAVTGPRLDHHLSGALTPGPADCPAGWAAMAAREPVRVGGPDGQEADADRWVPPAASAGTEVRHMPMPHALGLAVTLGPGLQARFGLWRRPERGPFGPAARARLASLAPHLCRAARARLRLVEAEAVWTLPAAAVERLDLAVARYRRDGRFAGANGAMRRLAARRDGLALGPAGLEPARPWERTALADAIRGGGAARLAISRPLHPVPYVADVVATGGSTGHVMVVVSDPAAGAETAAVSLASLFGLTEAQARLAEDIAAGVPLPAHAKAAGIPLETARSRLKAVLARTSCRRRTDLAALVARLPELSATP